MLSQHDKYELNFDYKNFLTIFYTEMFTQKEMMKIIQM